jgi:hypothetical protein
MTETRRSLPPWLSALLCLAPVLIVTWPLPVAPHWQMIDGFFQWGQVWGTGLVWDALDHGHLPRLETDWLDFPRGGVVVLIGWSTHLLACFLNLFLPLLAAFNLAVLVHLWLATWTGTLLIQRITGEGWGSLAGGILFGCGPMAQWAVSSGQLDQYSHAWIALFLLALLAWLQRGGLARMLLLVGAALGLLFSHPQGAVMSAPLFALLGAVELWRSPSRRLVLQRGLVGAVVCLPPALLAGWYFGHAEASLLAPPLRHDLGEPVSGILLGLLRVGDWTLQLPLLPREQASIVFTLGLVPVALAGFGLRSERRGAVLLWAGITLAALALSMGRWTEIAGIRLPLPLVMLAAVFPPAGRISDATRFSVLTQLGLGVLMALGFTVLRQRLSGRALPAVLAGLFALFLLELLHPHGQRYPPGDLPDEQPRPMAGGVHTVAAAYPEVYASFAGDPEVGALLEFPNQPGMSSLVRGELTQRQMFYQAFHRRPLGMLDKNNDRAAWVMGQPAIAQLVNQCKIGRCVPGEHEVASALYLKHQGFTHLMFHPGWLEPEYEARCLAFLDELHDRKTPPEADGPILYQLR